MENEEYEEHLMRCWRKFWTGRDKPIVPPRVQGWICWFWILNFFVFLLGYLALSVAEFVRTW